MLTKTVTKVNDVAIQVIENNREKLVPIKPICEALGIIYESQINKIKEHQILSSTISRRDMVAADGKVREMSCIPLQYVFGWLFTINPSNVKEETKESLIKYQTECYNALYIYFTSRAEFVELKQNEIDKQLTVVDTAKNDFKNAKYILSDAEAKLKQIRMLTMNDYDAERRQLKICFPE